MRLVATIVVAGVLAAALSADLQAAPPANSVTRAELQSWLAQLDDEDYARREEATQRLHAAGEAAIEALAQGALAGSPEVAWRAGEALKRIAISGSERTIERVAAALDKLSLQGRPGMHKVVAEIRARRKQLRHDRAAVQIRRLGGGLTGGGGGFGAEIAFGALPLAMPLVDLAPVEVADEVARVEEAALEAAEAVEKPTADEKLAAQPAEESASADEVAEFRELEHAGPVAEAVEEARADLAVAVDLAAADLGGEIAAVEVFGAAMLGGDFMIETESAEGSRAEGLTLDANWRGGDRGLEAVRDLPDIVSVSIQGAKLGDAALKPLATLPKLRSINIQKTVFSAAALRELHRARPAAYMFCQGDAMLGIHADTTGPCVLTSVYAGSGAAEAGLAQGDRILAIDGLEIRDFSELTISVYARKAGEKLKVEYQRDGKRLTAEVELKPRSVLEPARR
jgi:hypothetical protein